jgi:hypothetical protein
MLSPAARRAAGATSTGARLGSDDWAGVQADDVGHGVGVGHAVGLGHGVAVGEGVFVGVRVAVIVGGMAVGLKVGVEVGKS